jgi:hypothetical protein
MSATAKLFKVGRFQAIRFPREFRMAGTEVVIRREGTRVVLTPLANDTWPPGFFRSIRIKDRRFQRPAQGRLPPASFF